MKRVFNEEFLADYVNTDRVSIGEEVIFGYNVESLIQQVENYSIEELERSFKCKVVDRNKYSFVIEDTEGERVIVPFVYKWEGITPDPITCEVLCKVSVSADSFEDAENKMYDLCKDSEDYKHIVIYEIDEEK